jgi:hypothetical protein
MIELENNDIPDKKSISNNECLICLEELEITQTDIESNKINLIRLPCSCSSNIYHKECIKKMLTSGKNKNFCPHCKTKYPIPSQQVLAQLLVQVLVQPIYVQLSNLELQRNEINELKFKTFRNIFLVHMTSNSFMNLINLAIAYMHPQFNIKVELKVLLLIYFIKLSFNFIILTFSKNNLKKIEISLYCSYIFQIVTFVFLIYSFTKIKKNYLIIWLLTNILISFGDLIYRIIMENKMNIRVNIIG